jgi:hypothetical protein
MRRAPLIAALMALAASATVTATATATATAAALRPAKPATPARRAHPIAGLIRDVPTGTRIRAPIATVAANLTYGGGPVLHSNRAHLIFWEPSGSGLAFDPSYESLIETFLTRVAADSHKTTNVYGLSGQYRDMQGPAAYASTYGGAVIDTDPLPPPPYQCAEPATGPGWLVCLTDSQLEAEIDHVVAADRLPHGDGDVYFLVMPDGFGSCVSSGPGNCALGGGGTGYCGYHSETPDGVVYAVIPYNAVEGHCQSDNPRPNGNAADPTISTISHEHNEMVTDPAGDAWIDANGSEDGDLCITNFGPTLGGTGSGAFNEVIDGGHYYLQEEWSNENRSCRPRANPDRLWFTAPPRGQAREPLQFAAHASTPFGSIVAYTWYFGDRATARGRVATHSYQGPGSYRVVLRATDTADNWALHAITIAVSKAPAQDRRPAGGARPPRHH